MTSSIVSVSRTELSQRRRQLRQRRRIRFLQTSWRILAVSGLAGGAIWVATLPTWVIRRPDQVTIEGNRFLPVQTIRTLLPIAYPQSLLRIEPQTIAQELKAKAPIADVIVNRQLIPPGLVVQVKERLPVAIAIAPGNTAKAGLLDENGMWMPLERFTALDKTLKLPTLKVTGNPESYRTFWPTFYREISHSPIKVLAVDWQDPTNLILNTELGLVHIGPYSPQFPVQLNALGRMRKLSNHASFNQIAYIDLKIPESPTVQLGRSKDPVKSGTP